MGRRVLITGISKRLGADLAARLANDPKVDYVSGVGSGTPTNIKGVEFIKADVRSPLIQRVLTSTRVDTVVHADLTSNPMQVGGRSNQKERNVIGTMQLLAACQRVEAITKVVVRSSTAVYGSEAGDPSILTEEWSSKTSPPVGYSKDVSEAETYARDFGRRRPDVELTILRMANVVGPTAQTNMTELFSLPLVPTAVGFDPRLQLLHEDDAAEVLYRAVVEDHVGVYNVAADGIIFLSQAIRLARRFPFPIISPLGEIVGDSLRRLGLVDFPTDQIKLLVHGRVVDNTRLKDKFGYTPAYTTLQAFLSFLEARSEAVYGPEFIVELERKIYERISEETSKGPRLVKAGESG
jgi:UDP-glucose 4-epimerase